MNIQENSIKFKNIQENSKKQMCKKKYISFLIFNFQKDYKCGEKSTLVLMKKLKDKKIECILQNNKDRYKRYIGTCYIENQDIYGWLVKNGHAIAYKNILKNMYYMKNMLKKINWDYGKESL